MLELPASIDVSGLPEVRRNNLNKLFWLQLTESRRQGLVQAYPALRFPYEKISESRSGL